MLSPVGASELSAVANAGEGVADALSIEVAVAEAEVATELVALTVALNTVTIKITLNIIFSTEIIIPAKAKPLPRSCPSLVLMNPAMESPSPTRDRRKAVTKPQIASLEKGGGVCWKVLVAGIARAGHSAGKLFRSFHVMRCFRGVQNIFLP